MNTASRRLRSGLILFLAALAAAAAGTGHTQPAKTGGAKAAPPKASAADIVKESMDAFWNANYDRAEQLARSVVSQADAGKTDLTEAHKVLACVYTMERARHDAIDSLVRMFELDPTARFSPDAHYPPPVISNYYTVRDSLFSGTMDVKTIAVGDFENNSVYTGKFKDYDFGALAKALPHLITLDLTGATDLKVVDRQRTADILKEMQLSVSGFADPDQAVKAGKLLGAHAFIFGQYMLLSASKVRIDARVVRTATGEVVVAKQITGEFSGDPEKFMALEKALVTDLMETLGTSLGAGVLDNPDQRAQAYFDQKEKSVAGRPGYVSGVFLTAEALDAEQKEDYKGAVEKWKKVLEADPGNEVAKIRVQVLEQVAQG